MMEGSGSGIQEAQKFPDPEHWLKQCIAPLVLFTGEWKDCKISSVITASVRKNPEAKGWWPRWHRLLFMLRIRFRIILLTTSDWGSTLSCKKMPNLNALSGLKDCFKGTVFRDRFRKCWRKLTDLGLNKGRGWFLNFSEAPPIFGWN